MKNIKIISMLAILLVSSACTSEFETEVNAPDILPLPRSAEHFKGSFNMNEAQVIIDDSFDADTRVSIESFGGRMAVVLGKEYPVNVCHDPEINNRHGIYFIHSEVMGEDEYTIDSQVGPVVIRCGSRSGALNAIATLKQMMPVEIYANKIAPLETDWRIPRMKIYDSPLFGYRGMHLDCSRHFFEVDEVKRYIEVMSFYKLNSFHWHLTDDQGWRVEIKSHPELTEIGGWRDGTVIRKNWDSNDGIRHGGFYTQEEIRGVIEFADSLGITVIPEIDLPGHMQAVLAAHPELGCTGGPYKVWTRWGVSQDVLCVGRDATMKLLFEVLDEITDLFPSKYIHVGGDECPKDRWKKCPRCQARIRELGLKSTRGISAEQKLQNYVMSTVGDFLHKKGKKLIGWDEILEGGELDEETIIMSWRGTKGGIKAAERGLRAIMTPSNFLYFDHYQSEEPEDEPFAIGGHNTLERVYAYNPLEGFTPEQYDLILGVQANLWTEYIATPEHLEYMLLPRLQALSELQWCEYSTRDIARMKRSLNDHQYRILNLLNYNYRNK